MSLSKEYTCILVWTTRSEQHSVDNTVRTTQCGQHGQNTEGRERVLGGRERGETGGGGGRGKGDGVGRERERGDGGGGRWKGEGVGRERESGDWEGEREGGRER